MHELIDRIVWIDKAACDEIEEAKTYAMSLADSVDNRIAEIKSECEGATSRVLAEHRQRKEEEFCSRCEEIDLDTQDKIRRMLSLCEERRDEWTEQIYRDIIAG